MSTPSLIEAWKKAGKTIVFTNGCFDLLHPGHIQYLREAAECGEKLVVGLNSDASVTRIKGPDRPVNDVTFRKTMLENLKPVDLVCIFEADTPIDLIRQVRPDVLVKGGDYKPDEVVGGDYVSSYGGRVEVLSFVEGYSSSSIITKIKDLPL